MKKFKGLIIIALLILSMSINADVKLPTLLSDNMVLQRDVPVNIWGSANPGEKVTVTFNKQVSSSKADKNGNWKVQLKSMTAGGPFDLTIKGKNEITLKNILIGDVWICGGQSNMELASQNTAGWDKEGDTANLLNNLRLITIKQKMSSSPLDTVATTKWMVCDKSTATRFSAVGYYFGKNMHKYQNIPIGLISSNWGGTDIEPWISLDAMYKDPDYKGTIENMKSKDMAALQKEAQIKAKQWNDTVANSDKGILEKWYLPQTDEATWKKIHTPQVWESAGYDKLDGIAWYRKELILDKEPTSDAQLSLGPIDDNDETYVNGELVGKSRRYDFARKYTIKPGILKAGKNVIAVKVVDNGGGGGIYGNEDQLYIDVNGSRIKLSGDWLFKVSIDLPAQQSATSPNSFPSLLYNGMIHPLLYYAIKGVIWYQGENNVGNTKKYRSLFPTLINDWRANWKIDFPFLFVQLANYMAPAAEPGSSNWAELREAQTMTLSVPKTGMAVIIDIGEANNIHPKNKKDVGYRLSLAARKVMFNENIVYSGPSYKSVKFENGKAIVEFDNIGSGLLVKNKYGYVNAFAIAGADKVFYWAKAYIQGDKIIVFSDKVVNPVAVRYAWANNPDDVNLYNKEMLPAGPFRTDQW